MYQTFVIKGTLPEPSRRLDQLADLAIVSYIYKDIMPTNLKLALSRAKGQVDVTCNWYVNDGSKPHEDVAMSQVYVTAAISRFVPGDVAWVQTASDQFRLSHTDPRVEVCVSFEERR